MDCWALGIPEREHMGLYQHNAMLLKGEKRWFALNRKGEK